MSKVKLYVERVNRYYKLKLKPTGNRNEVGVLYHEGYGAKNAGLLWPKDKWVEHFKTVIPDEDWVSYRGSDNNIEYHWQIHYTPERSMEILNELFDVEMLEPKERINQTIKLPVDLINELKKALKSVEQSAKDDSYRDHKHLKGEIFKYKNSTTAVKGDDIVVVDGQKEFTSLAAASRYISVVSVNPWTTFKTSEGVTPDEMCRQRSNFKESTDDLVEMREYPISEHVLQWIKKVK